MRRPRQPADDCPCWPTWSSAGRRNTEVAVSCCGREGGIKPTVQPRVGTRVRPGRVPLARRCMSSYGGSHRSMWWACSN